MPFDLKNGPGGNKLTVLLCICVLGTKVVFHLHCFSHRITKSSNLQTPSNGRSELDTLPPVTSSCASNCLSNLLRSISAVIGLLEKLCKDFAVPTAIVNCKRYIHYSIKHWFFTLLRACMITQHFSLFILAQSGRVVSGDGAVSEAKERRSAGLSVQPGGGFSSHHQTSV